MAMYWGYRNCWGRVVLNVLDDPFEIVEARKSPSVYPVCGPFKAANYDAALVILKQNLEEIEASEGL